MPRTQRESERFRAQATEILEGADWLDEEVHRWLRKQVNREAGCVYSEREHAALRRIVAASTLFDGWEGYSIRELVVGASSYIADYNEDDGLFLKDRLVRGETQLRLREMGQLVRICRFAGMDLPRFKPAIKAYDETV
jgi:hypothetical protein